MHKYNSATHIDTEIYRRHTNYTHTPTQEPNRSMHGRNCAMHILAHSSAYVGKKMLRAMTASIQEIVDSGARLTFSSWCAQNVNNTIVKP